MWDPSVSPKPDLWPTVRIHPVSLVHCLCHSTTVGVQLPVGNQDRLFVMVRPYVRDTSTEKTQKRPFVCVTKRTFRGHTFIPVI